MAEVEERRGGVTPAAARSGLSDLPPVDPESLVNRATLAIGEALRVYHRHHVRGMRHLVKALAADRPVIIVGNHCMDIVDPLMLAVAVYRATGRILRFVAHGKVFFERPVLRELCRHWGFVPNGRIDHADSALQSEGALVIYPGGASEAILRSYRNEPYRLKWGGRLGFVELALRRRATVLFVAGVGIDELYFQTRIPIPPPLLKYGTGDPGHYRGARFGLGATGLHLLPGLTPLPVRVTHVFSPALCIDYSADPSDGQVLERIQRRVWARCQRALNAAVAARHRDSDFVDAVCRHALSTLQRVGL